MSNTLLKKVTATAAALSIVLSIVSPVVGVQAADDSTAAANRLAALGVIVDNSQDVSKYNLESNITRREMLKIMMNLSSVEVGEVCEGKFSDLKATDWGCKYAEAALTAGFIAANAKFRPNDMVTEAEALKMVMQARGIAKADGVADWAQAYADAAVTAGILTEAKVSTKAAKRSMVIVIADSAVTNTTDDSEVTDSEGTGDTEDDLSGLFGDLFGDEGDDMTGSTVEDNTGSTVEDNTGSTVEDNTSGKTGDLEVSLNPASAVSTTLPDLAEGVEVASYDLTAGSSDVSVSSVKLTRKGLGVSAAVNDVALYANGVRVSKAKSFNSSDDYADVSISPALVVKAGSTVTLVAKVNTKDVTSNQSFAIEFTSLVSTAANVTGAPVVGNKFDVQNTAATSITIKQDGTAVNPKLGENQSELFKFSVKNNAENNEDVWLKEITLKEESSIDENTSLANLTLYYAGKEVAKVASMSSKYVTFVLTSPVLVADGKTEKFTVKADIVGGAGDKISFIVDNDLDVSATSTKYGYVSIDSTDVDTVVENGELTVQAGELTLVDVDAPSDKIREDKDDVVLGTVKITNVAGKNLELQQFGVKATLTPGTATVVGGGALSLATLFENFELVQDGGSAYDLVLNGSVYKDADLNITIPQGTTTFTFRADTLKDITNFNTASVEFNLSVGAVGANGGLYVVEADDDTVVTDVTPSSLSFKKVQGSEAGATVSVTPLADVTKVRGTDDTVVLQYEVEADESSSIFIDEAKVFVAKTVGAVAASNLEVKQVSLYKGAVAESNLLDRVSGSSLASGVATFDGFNVEVAANAKQTFVVTLSIVDGADAVLNTPLKARLDSLSVEDTDRDDVVVTNVPTFSRLINVANFGTISIVEDINNDENKNTKTILAGESMKVFSTDVQSTNESVDVETVTFTVASTLGSIKKAVTTATLYLGDVVVGTAQNSDITDTSITFKNLTQLIIPQETKELKLALNTSNIGFEYVGETVKGFSVSKLKLDDAEGVSSGKAVTFVEDAAVDSDKEVSIVPATVLPSVTSTLNGGQAKLKITVNSGNNRVAASNAKPSVLLTDLVFSALGNNVDGYDVYKEGESARKGTISSAGVFAAVAMTADDLTISTESTYVIVPKGTVDKTYTLNLVKDGVVYTVNAVPGLKSNLTTELELGTRTY